MKGSTDPRGRPSEFRVRPSSPAHQRVAAAASARAASRTDDSRENPDPDPPPPPFVSSRPPDEAHAPAASAAALIHAPTRSAWCAARTAPRIASLTTPSVPASAPESVTAHPTPSAGHPENVISADVSGNRPNVVLGVLGVLGVFSFSFSPPTSLSEYSEVVRSVPFPDDASAATLTTSNAPHTPALASVRASGDLAATAPVRSSSRRIVEGLTLSASATPRSSNSSRAARAAVRSTTTTSGASASTRATAARTCSYSWSRRASMDASLGGSRPMRWYSIAPRSKTTRAGATRRGILRCATSLRHATARETKRTVEEEDAISLCEPYPAVVSLGGADGVPIPPRASSPTEAR